MQNIFPAILYSYKVNGYGINKLIENESATCIKLESRSSIDSVYKRSVLFIHTS